MSDSSKEAIERKWFWGCVFGYLAVCIFVPKFLKGGLISDADDLMIFAVVALGIATVVFRAGTYFSSRGLRTDTNG